MLCAGLALEEWSHLLRILQGGLFIEIRENKPKPLWKSLTELKAKLCQLGQKPMAVVHFEKRAISLDRKQNSPKHGC